MPGKESGEEEETERGEESQTPLVAEELIQERQIINMKKKVNNMGQLPEEQLLRREAGDDDTDDADDGEMAAEVGSSPPAPAWEGMKMYAPGEQSIK